MKGKIIAIFFVFVFLLSFIPSDSIKATSINSRINFEGFPAPGQYSGGTIVGLTTVRKAGAFNISAVSPHTGVRSFSIGAGCKGWWNLSYSLLNVITQWKTWIYNDPGNIGRFEIGFYNKTLGSSINFDNYPSDSSEYSKYMVIMGSNLKGTSTIGYINSVGSAVNVVTWSGVAGWYDFNWTTTSDVGDILYMYRGASSTLGTACNMTSITNNYRIDRMYFKGISSLPTLYMDDLNFTTSNSYAGTGGGSGGCVDLSSYTMFGNTHSNYGNDIKEKGIRVSHGMPVTATIKAIQLPIYQSFFNDYDDNLNNYSLYIGLSPLGSPSCSFDENGITILEWDVSISLTNELLYLTFYHDYTVRYGDIYWQIYTGGYDEDIDRDGYHHYFTGNDDPSITTYWDGDYYSQHHDIVWAMYILQDIINPPPEETYNDTLGVSGYLYKNSTGYVYDINSPIILDYTLTTTAYNYQIIGYNNGSIIWDLIFPFNCIYPSGNCIYYTQTIGKYNFSLIQNLNTLKKKITCWVIGNIGQYRLYTMPTSTNQFESYSVYYKYLHGSIDGVIGCFSSIEDANSLTNAIYRTNVIDGTTGSFVYSGNEGNIDYWRMFVNNSYNTPVGEISIHYIQSQSGNTLTAIPENLIIKEHNPDMFYTTIEWSHLFSGSDIKIKVGNTEYTAKEGYGRIQFRPTVDGTYTARMYKDQNGTIEDLAFCYFTVTIDETVVNPDENGDIGELLPPPYSYIMGAIITIVLMILPSIALGKIGMSGSESLKYVPIFSGTMGFILSCLIGFFPWYSIFALLFVLILIIVVLYLAKNKSG